MSGNQEARRMGLGAKLNIVLIASILAITLGLVLVSYRVYCQKVDNYYLEQVERAANSLAVPYQYMSHLLEMTDTYEFRAVRERAIAENDEQIIRDWMIAQPPVEYELENLQALEALEQTDETRKTYEHFYSLYGEYDVLAQEATHIKELFGLTSVYIQYYKDGLTYTLVDPDEGLLSIGEAEEPIPAFSQYVGNVHIPPTIFRYGDQMLCTTCEPLEDNWHGEDRVVGMTCVDIDMNDVVRERHLFLLNGAVFITIITLAAMGLGLLLTRKLATKPLKLLSAGATGFAKGDGSFSEDDIIRLPIRSNDEIGDLYREIQSMQRRIVDGTARLTKITAERERVHTGLDMAAQIQTAMLPREFPAFPGRPEFDLFASMDPAKEVGGDFYDFFPVDNDHLALVIADVSDKGVPAALFMMASKIIIKYRAQMGGSPAEIISSVNAQLCQDNKTKMFVTVWLGILELSTGKLTCVNAGHEYPFLRAHDGRFRKLQDKHGMMVGAMEQAKYTDYTLSLEPGDSIFVYTDGVPEANNAAGAMYGMERLEAALNRLADRSPEDILHGVRRDVDVFVDGAEQFDDVTMLCLEYKGLAKENAPDSAT